MPLVTLRNATPDGRLVALGPDLARVAEASDIAATMQQALERWDAVAPALRARAATMAGAVPFDPAKTLAPLPRAWQWLDGSAFPAHGALMQNAFDLPPIEMKTGFGWILAKPASSLAPLAVTPDALGTAWSVGRVHGVLAIDRAGVRLGRAHGGAMAVGFHELIAHAAATRELCAGTIIGSGTVSNQDCRVVGSSCISERRAIELVDNGAPQTPFMRVGETVRMEMLHAAGQSVLGVIEQRVVASPPAAGLS